MGMITLRQLRYLSALAKHGHFGRAAEACAVTQPALSMQIRDLERTLGVAVVERRPGDVMLTDVGREIARRAEDVLTASRDLVDFARHRRGLLTGRLTLGVIPSLAPYLLPRILPLLQSRFPELQLELLRAAAERVRPGGTIVYSVCTVNADESEAVVDASGLEVEPIEGWAQFRHARRPEFLQTLPHVHRTSGFFIARLRVAA